MLSEITTHYLLPGRLLQFVGVVLATFPKPGKNKQVAVYQFNAVHSIKSIRRHDCSKERRLTPHVVELT